jgi:hypothetical protein
MARKLLHLPNRPGLLDRAQISAYELGKFEGAKLMPEHTADNVAQLELTHPGGLYIARCSNSTRPDGSYYSYQELGRRWYEQIVQLHPVGVRIYQLDTEPNGQLPVHECFNWQWLITNAIHTLRSLLGTYWAGHGHSSAVVALLQQELQLWLAPLADGPGHWAEIEAQGGWWDAYKLILNTPNLVQGLCCDSYFQYAKHAVEDGFSANAAKYHRWAPSYKILVAEWGCSLIDKYPPEQRQHPTQAQLLEIEAEDLPGSAAVLDWYRAQPYIVATCRFICPGSAGWPGFEPSQKTLATIGQH